ncbi:MAG: TerC family protein [Actinobacteria bacterium]|nr:TerC family protein [Actinomycetota bacterium]
MDVPTWVWLATIGGLTLLLVLDLIIVDRRPHEVTVGEAACWVGFYVACAVVFGLGVWYFSGGQYATEFFAGYITEYSLSVDNLFIFVIIMSAFSVPAIHQHRVLLIGIVLALIMRGGFIALGAALIANFSWVFYLFGALLVGLGIQQIRQQGDEDEEYTENMLLRGLRKLLPVTDSYDGTKLTTRIDGRRFVTPMLIVMISIGTADLIFALDSIPAIFGLTREPFLVFTANAFALMGLRQLYFLIGGLLSRLVYLSFGLGVILSFIGVKLVLEALHENELPFINGGEHVDVWTPSITQSLGVIVSVLVLTTVASLLKARKNPSAAEHLS